MLVIILNIAKNGYTIIIRGVIVENIGRLLKEKRLALGMTIEEISKKTRLTVKHIKAIEEGDIEFFHDDLSYLRFFIKSYCDTIDLNFEDIKDELRQNIDEYTNSFTMTMQLNHEEIEKHIANSKKLSKVESTTEQKKTGKFHKPEFDKPKFKKVNLKKTDLSLVSLVAVVGVVAIVLMSAFVIYLKIDNKGEAKKVDEQPIADVQKENGNNKYPTTEEKENNKKEETNKEIEVVKDSLTQYTIDNAKDGDDLNFEVYFGGSNSGFSVSVDGKVLSEPVSKVYNYQSTAKATIKAKKGMKIQLNVGWMNATAVKLNGKNIKIDESKVNSNSSVMLEFSVAGDK